MKVFKITLLFCIILFTSCGKAPSVEENSLKDPPVVEKNDIEKTVLISEEPKTEEPKTEEPKTEEPKTEEPKTEEPKTEEPKAEEPVKPSNQLNIDFTRCGSSASNIANLGFVAEYQGYLYVHDLVEKVLFKMLPDGSEKQVVAKGDFYNLNILEDWIYYSEGTYGIWKMKVDGSEKTKLSDFRCEGISVIGDYIYYGDYDEYRLRRMKIDGTEDGLLTDDLCYEFFPFEDRLFMIGDEDKFYSMDLNGGDVKPITKSGWAYLIAQDWIYVSRNEGIYRTNLKDGREEKLTDIFCGGMNVHGEWIIFENRNDQVNEEDPLYSWVATLYKMKLDGSEIQKILDRPAWHIFTFDYLDGDWIYYYPFYSRESEYEDQILRRVSLDGTKDEPVTVGKMKK